jgi:hypothetical protein
MERAIESRPRDERVMKPVSEIFEAGAANVFDVNRRAHPS